MTILKISIRILRWLLLPYRIIKAGIRILRLFWFPNKVPILRKKLLFKTRPACAQILLIEGQGLVEIGSECSFGYPLGGFNRYGSVELQARYENSRIKVGDRVHTNNNVFICAANSIEIGDNCLIGQNVVMMDHEAHGINPYERNKLGPIGVVKLGCNTWIGNNVTILRDTIIGDNSIIAAGSVVKGEFPSNVIIGGIPGRIIKVIS